MSKVTTKDAQNLIADIMLTQVSTLSTQRKLTNKNTVKEKLMRNDILTRRDNTVNITGDDMH